MDTDSKREGVSRLIAVVFANQWRSVSFSAGGAALFVIGGGVPGALGHVVANGGWILLAVGFVGLAYQGIVKMRSGR